LITAIIKSATTPWLIMDENVICWLSALSWASTAAFFFSCVLL